MRMTRMQLDQPRSIRLLIPCALMVLQAMACGPSQAALAPVPTVQPTLEPARTITLGDIDPDPGKKIKRFAPPRFPT